MKFKSTRTKIVCTIGPASESEHVIESMILGGMNVARLNFSHGTREDHRTKIRTIRRISDGLGVPVAILQDLGGPKIRIGTVAEPGVRLEVGDEFILTSEPVESGTFRVSVSYHPLPGEVREGDTILLADGMLELKVVLVREPDIHCEVVQGGVLTSHKGINLPTRTVGLPALTEKDRLDLSLGISEGVDYVAVSFVRDPEDVSRVKRLINENGSDIPLVAKIEKHEAVKNLDDIMAAADGVMVARGDLGVEIPLAEVPMIQKRIIKEANLRGKPVITATQMLRSMVESPRPTRAEATDVVNAVLDGTDAVMLSEETAMGSYPVEAVRFMADLLRSAEQGFPHEHYLAMRPETIVSPSVAHASCVLAAHLNAAAIVPNTQSGLTAIHISRFRPACPILALSPHASTARRLCLYWGVQPRVIKKPKDTDDMIESAAASVFNSGHVSTGDLVVITAGHPVWVPGTTNMIRVKEI
ncbi:MAG TPA: pyruvate kinase [Desulfobacteraceae bacterium]|nr:pyruvate kinase [Desulfobacteraceae bacterium]